MAATDPDVVAIISPSCPFCAQSVAAWNELANRGVRVVGFSVADATAFVAATDAKFPIKQVTAADFAELGVRGVPRTLVVEEDKITFVHPGLLQDAARVLDNMPGGGKEMSVGVDRQGR